MCGANSAPGQAVGIKEVQDGFWLVSFMDYDLGYIDLEEKTLQPLHNPFGSRVYAMSSERSVKDLSGLYREQVVGAKGFEPSTSWSRTRRASQAALRPDAVQQDRELCCTYF